MVAKSAAAAGVPLTVIMERPDGVEYRRQVGGDQGLGGRSLSVPLVSTAPTGTWRVRVHVDPKGAAVGESFQNFACRYLTGQVRVIDYFAGTALEHGFNCPVI